MSNGFVCSRLAAAALSLMPLLIKHCYLFKEWPAWVGDKLYLARSEAQRLVSSDLSCSFGWYWLDSIAIGHSVRVPHSPGGNNALKSNLRMFLLQAFFTLSPRGQRKVDASPPRISCCAPSCVGDFQPSRLFVPAGRLRYHPSTALAEPREARMRNS